MAIKDFQTLADKGSAILRLNYWAVWIGLVVLTLTILWNSSSMSSDIAEMKDLLKKEVRGVVLLSEAGEVIDGRKNLINANNQTAFNAALANILSYYLTLDRETLSPDLGTYQNLSLLYGANKKLTEFRTNFVENSQQSLGRFDAIIGKVMLAHNEAKLIDSFKAQGYKIAAYDWDFKSQKFEISLNATGQAVYFDKNTMGVEKRRGTYEIRGSGYMDVNKRTPINPLGIQFSEINIVYVTR